MEKYSVRWYNVRIITLISITIIIWACASCNLINPNEEIPTYLQIDSIQVENTNPNYHGSTSHKITDAWVYVNNDLVGAFELPAKIPVLLKDGNKVTIGAGILENGLRGYRVRYPFYKLDEFVLEPSPGKTVSYLPKVSYQDSLLFHIKEDFETGNNFVYYFGDTSISRTFLPEYVFEGNAGGLVILKDTVYDSQSITLSPLTLPYGKQAYIELDYMANTPFKVSLQVETKNGEIIRGDLLLIYPKSYFNKVYINITSQYNQYTDSRFKFIIETARSDSQDSAFVAIDNFKVITTK